MNVVKLVGDSAGPPRGFGSNIRRDSDFKRIPVTSLLANASDSAALPMDIVPPSTFSSSDSRPQSFCGSRPRSFSMQSSSEGPSECYRSDDTGTNLSRQSSRSRWTREEDVLLNELVRQHGARNWNMIAAHFPGRKGRQVRLRWKNHLTPDVEDREWTKDEDSMILDAQQRFGNKWTRIASMLRGRSDNATKNRFNRLQRARRMLNKRHHPTI